MTKFLVKPLIFLACGCAAFLAVKSDVNWMGFIPGLARGPAAKFVGSARVDEECWALRESTVVCEIMAPETEDLTLLGCEVPCPCISTKQLPTTIPAGTVKQILFHVSLAGYPETEAGRRIPYTVNFLAANGKRPFAATFELVAECDLKGGSATALRVVQP